jgi:hypothetical protein
MIVSTTPYNNNLMIEPFVLNWTKILSGEHKGKYATPEVNLKYFKDVFKNQEYEIIILAQDDFEYDVKDVSNIQLQIKYTFENKEYIIQTDKEKLTEEELKKLVAEDSATKKESEIKDLEIDPIKK